MLVIVIYEPFRCRSLDEMRWRLLDDIFFSSSHIYLDATHINMWHALIDYFAFFQRHVTGDLFFAFFGWQQRWHLNSLFWEPFPFAITTICHYHYYHITMSFYFIILPPLFCRWMAHGWHLEYFIFIWWYFFDDITATLVLRHFSLSPFITVIICHYYINIEKFSIRDIIIYTYTWDAQ